MVSTTTNLWGQWWWWLLLLIVIGLVALTMGSVHTPLAAVFNSDSEYFEIIWQLRMPRIINAMLVGGSLALAGLLIQNLVKNPLADPYLLGVSGGAATVQLVVIISGIALAQNTLFFFGFLGSLAATLLLLKLSYHGQIKPEKITLNGVVLAFGFAAIISFVLATASGQQVKSMMFWLMGDMSFAQPNLLMPVVILACMLLLMKHHRALDLLARGELFALKSGVNAQRINLIIFTITALLTAMAVAQAGTIGFVGLIIPHLVRLMTGFKHQNLIPMCFLVGACFLVAADTLARTIMSPIQLPVGVFTAMIGVPVFLMLNRKV
ncbi:iron ABC transporter permease [Marinicella sp. S1101]|uniref:FecCD family ABC transporter permease n=1 Tax=Marinicella marina TaxID=2996016 RepID=UPI002260ADF0|nr:iron ABC transporter permease [Marinicella marina]MCX7552318.1 iron ABC transporter permease [Marinicella marina]MDJ1139193.1 iron ABC transporter permease [Marinicella marina]